MADPYPTSSLELLEQAFALTPVEGGLSSLMREEFSNAPQQLPPEKGFPFGGLLAALCAKAMRKGLDIDAPLQTLSVQYLAAANYGQPLLFTPQMLRKGRQITYAAVQAAQGERLTHNASGTFGRNTPDAAALYDRAVPPPALDSLPVGVGMEGPFAPRFAQHAEYRFDGGPNIFGGNKDRKRVERCWIRMRDGQPLDEIRLCYLLDALYPPSWTGFEAPPIMTTVDLRYDFLTPPTPENAPDGWAYFEYSLIQHSDGWAVDDAIAWGADGSVLATSRQRRKVLGHA